MNAIISKMLNRQLMFSENTQKKLMKEELNQAVRKLREYGILITNKEQINYGFQ